jgi:ubiquinone biosynthesis protein
VEIEMDMRLEAAAISEMADNIARDATPELGSFRVPAVDWRRTARRVLTLEWVDGVPIANHAALRAAGHDLKALGLTVLRAFLRHAMRDGFFHADMHQGNLLVDRDGCVVAVDFGIMGRLGLKERRFLAEILHGLITRDYRRTAEVHFEAGYVPPHHPVEISMADLLGQLFAYTEVFDMATRPELILLQKTMVVVEGVARSLDPELNLWTAAEPIARDWVEANLGVAGRLREAGASAETLGRVLSEAPRLLEQAERAALALADTTREGFRLDQDTLERLAAAQARHGRWGRWALWVGALALVGIAVRLMLG